MLFVILCFSFASLPTEDTVKSLVGSSCLHLFPCLLHLGNCADLSSIWVTTIPITPGLTGSWDMDLSMLNWESPVQTQTIWSPYLSVTNAGFLSVTSVISSFQPSSIILNCLIKKIFSFCFSLPQWSPFLSYPIIFDFSLSSSFCHLTF